MSTEEALRYGFPAVLLDALDAMQPGPGPGSPCGLCGDTILGQRHRIIDAITERLRIGDLDPGEDWKIPPHYLGVIVMAHYEHEKALKRQRRAERKSA